MNKKDREIIFNKYSGRCAYCGCDLQRGWHVDEIIPVKRKYKYVDAHWKNKRTNEITYSHPRRERNITSESEWIFVSSRQIPDGCESPENYNINNQMPACASCNINKHSLSLEDFRNLIQGFMKHLNEINTQYKIAKRYGLIKEDIKPVIFYFETLNLNP